MHLRVYRYPVSLPAVSLGLLLVLDIAFVGFSWHWLTVDPLNEALDIGDGRLRLGELTIASWLVTISTMLAIALYSDQYVLDVRILLGVGIAFAWAVSVSWAVVFYVHNYYDVCGRCTVPPMSVMVVWAGWMVLTRLGFLAAVERGVLKRRVLVLGAGRLAALIDDIVESGRSRRFEPVAFVGVSDDENAIVSRERLHWHDAKDGVLAELVPQLGIEEVVVATSDRFLLSINELLVCKRFGINVITFHDFWERETRSVNLQALQPNWASYSKCLTYRRNDLALKRAFDIVAGFGLLIFTLPLQLLTACLIKLDSPGPVFYRQERIGLRGRPFMMFKFRSMRADAEKDGRPRWASQRDPRVTRVGRVIRKLRIDELPQILNVLRGDMSLIGPRPERPFFVNKLVEVIPDYDKRHMVRPGITGWAQVNYPYGDSIDDAKCKLSFDLYYVKKGGIFLDLHILMKTVAIVFALRGR